MEREECMEKIRKLLALAGSDNENEAMAALLKAKELMAKAKVEEFNLKDRPHKDVKLVETGLTCSKRRTAWMVDLAGVVGLNFCCQAGRRHEEGKRTNEIFFIGLDGEVDACATAYKNAVDAIMEDLDDIWDYADEAGLPLAEKRSLCDGYGFGFTSGIKEAFERQKGAAKGKYALALAPVLPKEVQKYVDNMVAGESSDMTSVEEFSEAAQGKMSFRAWESGYEEGKKFEPEKLIEDAEREAAEGQEEEAEEQAAS